MVIVEVAVHEGIVVLAVEVIDTVALVRRM